MMDNQICDQDQPITSIADAVVKLKELRESNKNLNEPDIEERFARLSLAFKTDKFTLEKRLELQLRQRDIAEKDINNELRDLRESLNALNQLCTESDMREIITKTQQHVDIVEQATMHMSSRAETYGSIQQEQKLNCAFETMLNYVEHLKLLYDKEHLELEEYRRLLAEHNLLPDEKNSMDDDSKRILPPRSHSLSSSSKPEARTRLLSAVCLLNNNYDSLTFSNTPVQAPSLSPKSRRSSLPVGPLAHSSTLSSPQLTVRAHTAISEKRAETAERRESQAKLSHESHLTRTESEESTNSKPEADSSCSLPEHSEEISNEDSSHKDSSELKIPTPFSPATTDQANCLKIPQPLQESACDNEIDSDTCLLPEIVVPVRAKPLYVLKLFQKASARRIWRWDNATLLMHARYVLSAILATAAMFTLVLTFVPNHVMAHDLNDSNRVHKK